MSRENDIIRREAIERNMCAEGVAEWMDDTSDQQLFDKYKKYIDFILSQDDAWPSNEFLRDNFSEELRHSNLVFVDEDIDLDNAPSGVYVLNGNCTGSIRLAPWSVATLYLRHDTDVRIVAGDFSRVFVRLYDNADSTVNAAKNAVVKVYDRRK